MKRGAWLTHPASIDLVFDTAIESLWKSILQDMGPEYRLLADAPEDPSVN
jgi:putative transcriptional regulator